MRKNVKLTQPTCTLGFFKAAVVHHIRTGAILHEAAEAAFCIFLIHLRAPDRLGGGYFVFYPALSAVIISGTIAYRRTMMYRQERFDFHPADITNRFGFLLGEMLACLAISLALVFLTTGIGLAMAPAAMAGVGAVLCTLLVCTLLAATGVVVTFFFSWLTLGSDLPSVLSIVILVFGVSRSALSTIIMGAVSFKPLVFLVHIVTPPLEELIKCAMSGAFSTGWLFLVQNALFTALLGYWSFWLFARRDLREDKGSAEASRSRTRQRA